MLISLSNRTGQPASFNPAHLLAMTDDTGMFQHCRFSIPDRRHGYTLDDNVRALLATAQSADPVLIAQLPIYLSFVMYCQKADGLFVNFMGYDRRFLETVGSPDSQGRTLWALGVLYREKPRYRQLAEPVLAALRKHLPQLTSPRALAFAVLGLASYGQIQAGQIETELTILADRLVKHWEINRQPDWYWFEDYLTYENARFPQALFAAYLVTGNKCYSDIACQAADFLEELHFKTGYLKLIGNKGWLKRGVARAEFDEQPVDAGALVEMYTLAYQATSEKRYSDLAHRAFAWYGGSNCHKLPLYDPVSGGCYDGLTVDSVNYNQGAESVLSYLLAEQSLLKIAQPDNNN